MSVSLNLEPVVPEPRQGLPDGERPVRILRPREVFERTALSQSHLYRLMGEDRFPRYYVIAGRSCGLPEHVLDAFLAERMAARDSLPPLGSRPPLPKWCFDDSKVPAKCGIRLLRRCDVETLTGLPKSTFYPLIPQGFFPMQVSLGERAARWVAHEVAAWAAQMGAPPPGPMSGQGPREGPRRRW